MRVAAAKIKEWRESPSTMCRELIKIEPDFWQNMAFEAFASNDPEKQRIALSACAGPGKTFALAVMAWNFMLCYGEIGEHPKAIALSVTDINLSTNLWPELSKVQSRSELLLKTFTWTKSRIFANDHPQTWFMQARSYSKTANKDEQGRTLSGLHSKFVLILIDESGDITPNILKAAEQALGNCKFGKIVQAGNPTSKSGMLYEACVKARTKWHIIRITGDPDDPNRSQRIDIVWAREQIELYGRDDPWVQAYILGQFPDASIDTLLSLTDVELAIGRKYNEVVFLHSQKRLGVDCARFGLDSNVIFPRQGKVAFKPVEMRGVRGNELAARVISAKLKWGSELEFVDGTGGFGSSCIDSMVQAGFPPQEIQFAGKPLNPRYFNKRSENWFLMSEWVKRGGCLPNCVPIIAELVTPTYCFKNGKFLLEPKDLIKKRLGRSPDYADALSLTFSLPDMPAMTDMQRLSGKTNKAISEFDPFRDT